MIIKHGKGVIIDVVKDYDHNIDDELTRKAMVEAEKQPEEEKKEPVQLQRAN